MLLLALVPVLIALAIFVGTLALRSPQALPVLHPHLLLVGASVPTPRPRPPRRRA